MGLRKPPAGLNPEHAEAALRPAPQVKWQSYQVTLVTPMYGGGVVAGEVDRAMPVRASAIRGQLRFWWRLLARKKYGISNTDSLRQAEFEIWGGVGEKTQASKVWLRVNPPSKLDCQAWAHYEINSQGEWKSLPTPEAWADAAYALFPAQGKSPACQGAETPKALAKPGMHWKLQLGLDAKLTTVQTEQVQETLRWWACFGGLGARTRRGLGAVQVAGLEPVSREEVAAIGGRLVLGTTGQADALKAWQQGINKLRDFRQKEGLGRKQREKSSDRPGRSYWPEPDAIRRLTGKHHSNHAPIHEASNVFPRAAFGLPIIFQFGAKAKQGDPERFILNAFRNGRSSERMGSPVLIRPYYMAGKWYAAALLLPHEHVKTMSLSMPDGSIAKPEAWWQPEKAGVIIPMQGLGVVSDALEAFLAYFAR